MYKITVRSMIGEIIEQFNINDLAISQIFVQILRLKYYVAIENIPTPDGE